MVEHAFGGAWTDRKVELVRRYLDAYTTVMKKQRFKLVYVDAFAGTGYRSPKDSSDDPLLFTEFPEMIGLSKGDYKETLTERQNPVSVGGWNGKKLSLVQSVFFGAPRAPLASRAFQTMSTMPFGFST